MLQFKRTILSLIITTFSFLQSHAQQWNGLTYYSNMNSSNQKGLNLMKQVKPHLILTTHRDTATMEQLVQEWPNGYFVSQGPAILSKDKIPDGTGLFYMGNGASAYGKVYSLQEWK